MSYGSVNRYYVPSPIRVRGLLISIYVNMVVIPNSVVVLLQTTWVWQRLIFNVERLRVGAPLPDFIMLTLARLMQIVVRAVHEAFRLFSAEHLLPVLANVHREATAWRDLPDGSVEVMLADLQPA